MLQVRRDLEHSYVQRDCQQRHVSPSSSFFALFLPLLLLLLFPWVLFFALCLSHPLFNPLLSVLMQVDIQTQPGVKRNKLVKKKGEKRRSCDEPPLFKEQHLTIESFFPHRPQWLDLNLCLQFVLNYLYVVSAGQQQKCVKRPTLFSYL